MSPIARGLGAGPPLRDLQDIWGSGPNDAGPQQPTFRHDVATAWGTYVAVAGAVFALSFWTLWRITGPNGQDDIAVHAQLALKMVQAGAYFTYSLWYPLIFAFTGGSADPAVQRMASIALLSLAVVTKGVVVLYFARRYALSRPFAIVATALVLMAMPLVDIGNPADIYLGQLSAVVWHNSTTILAATITIPVLLVSARAVWRPTTPNIAAATGIVLISMLLKPNYALALVPIVALWLPVSMRRTGETWGSVVARMALFLSPLAALAAYLAFATYGSDLVFEERLHTVIAPLSVWNAFSANIPLSLALSLAGPLAALLALPPVAARSIPVVLSWATVGVAILLFALFAEESASGELINKGNWSWSLIPSMSALFFVMLVQLARAARLPGLSLERRCGLAFAGLLMAFHGLSGLFYVLNVGTPGFSVT